MHCEYVFVLYLLYVLLDLDATRRQMASAVFSDRSVR